MSATEEQSCLIRHPNKAQLLLHRREGLLELPTVSRDNSWFIGNRVQQICTLILEQTGLSTIVLRECPHPKELICELELLDPTPEPQGDYAFFDLNGIRQERFHDRRIYFYLRDGWQELVADENPVPSPIHWERPDWYADTVNWIHDKATLAGFDPGTSAQIKGAWEWSSLIRTTSNKGNLFFKADGRCDPGEAHILNELAKRHAPSIPSVIATDLDANWILMREFDAPLSSEGIRQLVDFTDLHADVAPRTAAKLQISERDHLDQWRALGMTDLEASNLPGLYDTLIADDGALGFDHKDGLRESDRIDLEDLRPRLTNLCLQISNSPIGTTLVNQDFRPGNVSYNDQGNPLFFDWSDTVLAHPFFALRRYLDFVRPERGEEHDAAALTQRIETAYFAPWMDIVDNDQIEHDWELVNKIRLAWMAIRWWRELPRLHRHTPWGRFVRSAVPACLKAWIG